MRVCRVILPILLAFTCLFLLWANALAQEPDDWHLVNGGDIWWSWYFPTDPPSNDYCTDGTDENCQAVFLTGAFDVDSYQNFYIPVEAAAIRINASKSAGGGIDFGVTNCRHIGNAPGDYTAHSWTSTVTCTSVLTPGWHTVYWANNSSGSNTTVYSITIEYYGAAPDEGGEGQLCSTVQNGEFLSDEGWLLVGGSTITNSILTLPLGSQAAQNLTLSSLTTYNAVISTTETVSSSTTIDVSLGTDIQTLEITQTGRYTASFTTPSLGGPIAYGLENIGDNSIDLEFTCLYTDTGGGQTGDCIAPINGTFETADDWTYLRGAEWDYPSKKAALPYPDVALIYSTSTYSLPTITGTEHLLLSFSSRKIANDTAAVMGRVRSGGSSVNWTFETYITDYVFETSLDTLAGLSDADVAFVNPGLTGSEEISSTADITLDDVCIFVANRGPRLPTPVDPDAIFPVEMGFNYTSCDDVDGLLAGFGVNIQQYRAEYYAGTSIWDPVGWVPWLIAAMWNVLATWLCIFMAAFVTFLDVVEHVLNNILNYGSWAVRSWANLITFTRSLLTWLLATLPNVFNWLGQAVILGVTWFWLSGGNIYTFLGFLLNYLIQAALDYLSFFGLSLPSNLIQRIINGLRAVVNVLIAAWNLLWPNVGAVISEAVDLLVLLWNLLVPFLSVVWGYVSKTSIVGTSLSLFFSMVMAVSGLFWMLVRWVWANVFMVLNLPLNFYYAYDNGVKSTAFTSLLACESQNFWCALLSGIDLVNHSSSHTIVYPIVIVGVIVGTLYVFRKELWALIHIEIS